MRRLPCASPRARLRRSRRSARSRGSLSLSLVGGPKGWQAGGPRDAAAAQAADFAVINARAAADAELTEEEKFYRKLNAVIAKGETLEKGSTDWPRARVFTRIYSSRCSRPFWGPYAVHCL